MYTAMSDKVREIISKVTCINAEARFKIQHNMWILQIPKSIALSYVALWLAITSQVNV